MPKDAQRRPSRRIERKPSFDGQEPTGHDPRSRPLLDENRRPHERLQRREPSTARTTTTSRSEAGSDNLNIVIDEDAVDDDDEQLEQSPKRRKEHQRMQPRRQSSSQSKRPEERTSQTKILAPVKNEESHLSSLGHRFIRIPLSNLQECLDFIKHNKAIADEPERNFLEEATIAVCSNKVVEAKKCIHRTVLLRNLFAETAAAEAFLHGIKKADSQVLRSFVQAQDKVYVSLSARANSRKSNARQNQSTVNPEETTSTSSAKKPHPTGFTHGAPAPGYSTYGTTRHDDAQGVSLPARISGIQLSGTEGTMGRPSAQPSDPECDSRFRPREKAFFSDGRVFEMLWQGNDDGRSYFSLATDEAELYGQSDHKFIRRLVVVARGQSSCTCVAIRTYGGRGLVGTNLRWEDIKAHAIAYMTGEAPTVYRGEPTMPKEPIKIHPAAPDQKLARSSRIDFSQPYDILYSSVVMNIGHVAPSLLHWLQRHYGET